jgi:hypothetical protein
MLTNFVSGSFLRYGNLFGFCRRLQLEFSQGKDWRFLGYDLYCRVENAMKTIAFGPSSALTNTRQSSKLIVALLAGFSCAVSYDWWSPSSRLTTALMLGVVYVLMLYACFFQWKGAGGCTIPRECVSIVNVAVEKNLIWNKFDLSQLNQKLVEWVDSTSASCSFIHSTTQERGNCSRVGTQCNPDDLC